MTQPILGTRLYVAWSHNNKNLILTGIFHQLTKEQILNKVLSIVKPSNVSENDFGIFPPKFHRTLSPLPHRLTSA